MSRPTDEQLAGLVDEALALLDGLRKHGPIVLRRAKAGGLADGYPTQSMGGAGGSGDATSRTERVGIQRAEEPRRDPVSESARTMSDALRSAVMWLRMADSAMRDVVEVVAPPHADEAPLGSRRPVNPVPDCLACDMPALPRPRRGMCESCFEAWVADGRPELLAFRHKRVAWAEQQRATKVAGATYDLIRRIAGDACALCGHNPACGRATAFDGPRVVLLCHADDHDCYERWTVHNIRPREAA